MPHTTLLEIACFNLESAVMAEQSGADRIELCENYNAGGFTPSGKIISEARKKIQLPLHVIIRPRGGDFNYSEYEIEEMKHAVLFCKDNKIDGIVFGVLNAQQKINLEVCNEIVQLAKPMSITFHRAIDHCKNTELSIQQLITLGISRVLTSGGPGNAPDHVNTLNTLQNKYGSKIIIMPGGGIRSSNIRQVKLSGCYEYHSAAITGKTELADASEIKQLKHFLKENP